MSQVVTVRNDEQPREACRKIGQNYYLMNRDVFEIGERWVREPLTFVDNYDGVRKLKSEHSYSTVYKDTNFNEVVTTTQVVTYYTSGGSTRDICASALNTGKLIPSWFLEGAYIDKNYKRIHPVRRTHKHYSMNESPDTAKLILSKKESHVDFDCIKKELAGLTFGFEIETSEGEILNKIVNDYKFVKLYDGSITGHEFVSVPFKSENFDYVRQFCILLKKACNKNMFCSTHVHVGGIPYSAENFTAIFSLFKRLEHEIHSIVPPYKKSLNYFASKRQNGLGEMKDHCKYLPDHVNLAEGAKNPALFTKQVAVYFANGNKVNVEHLGSDYYNGIFDTRKWNLNRYFFVNFVNYLFKQNGTIEFRLLESTFCFEHILYWTLLNVAITKYAIKEKKKVFDRKEKITLEDCVYGTYSEDVAVKIFEWIQMRRNKYSNYLNSMDDFGGAHHFDNSTDVSAVTW